MCSNSDLQNISDPSQIVLASILSGLQADQGEKIKQILTNFEEAVSLIQAEYDKLRGHRVLSDGKCQIVRRCNYKHSG
jgi:hypothetical protein